MKPSVLLIHHATNRGYHYPPNSLRGLKTCLDVGARVVETDISLMGDGEFLLLHDEILEQGTTGSGPVVALTADQAMDLYLTWQGAVTEEPVGLLSQALDLVSSCSQPVELQLDLKPDAPLDDETLANLVAALQPVKNRVRVTTGADWALRRLSTLDADLPLGFDPLLYLDVSPHETEEYGFPVPPFRQRAYGYWDDHPLATRRWGETADYLAARAEALWAQSPPVGIWYIRARLLALALEDGFDWIAYLHARGAQVAAWTLNAERSADVELAWQLATVGVDRITTDDPPALARALAECPQGSIDAEH
jgi:glycerophosphoryl diester phosphodiesterase